MHLCQYSNYDIQGRVKFFAFDSRRLLLGKACARRVFGLGIQIRCGVILMAAEPAYNTCDRQGLSPAI